MNTQVANRVEIELCLDEFLIGELTPKLPKCCVVQMI